MPAKITVERQQLRAACAAGDRPRTQRHGALRARQVAIEGEVGLRSGRAKGQRLRRATQPLHPHRPDEARCAGTRGQLAVNRGVAQRATADGKARPGCGERPAKTIREHAVTLQLDADRAIFAVDAGARIVENHVQIGQRRRGLARLGPGVEHPIETAEAGLAIDQPPIKPRLFEPDRTDARKPEPVGDRDGGFRDRQIWMRGITHHDVGKHLLAGVDMVDAIGCAHAAAGKLARYDVARDRFALEPGDADTCSQNRARTGQQPRPDTPAPDSGHNRAFGGVYRFGRSGALSSGRIVNPVGHAPPSCALPPLRQCRCNNA